MKLVRVAERAFGPTPLAGIEKAVLWRQGHGVAVELFRLAKGSLYPTHEHGVWESLLLLEGAVELSGHVLAPGDALFTEPGETHSVIVHEDSLALIAFGRD